MAVAVVIDRVVEVMRRQKLRLAEFASPRTDHLACREIAAIDDLQRGDGLLLEHLGAAAVVRQRHQRRQRMQLAQFGAKTALQPPERGDHGRRHPIFLLGAVERCRMHPDSRLRIFCRAIGRPVPGEFVEHLPEHALAAVAVDDALVVDEVGCRFRQRPLRHAGGDRLLLEVGEEAVERHAVVAGRAAARSGGRDRCCRGPGWCGGWSGWNCRGSGWSCRRLRRCLLGSAQKHQHGCAGKYRGKFSHADAASFLPSASGEGEDNAHVEGRTRPRCGRSRQAAQARSGAWEPAAGAGPGGCSNRICPCRLPRLRGLTR